MVKKLIFVFLSFAVLFAGKEPDIHAAATEQTRQNQELKNNLIKTKHHEMHAMQYFPKAEMFNDVEVPNRPEEVLLLKVETQIDKTSKKANFTWEPVEDAHYYVLWQLAGDGACLNVILWVGDNYSYKTDVLDGSRFLVTAYMDHGQEGIEDDTLVAYEYTRFLTLSSESTHLSKQYPSIEPCKKYTIVVDKEAHAMGVYERSKSDQYDRLVEVFPVATGRRRRQTPTGTFRIGGKYTWKRFPYRGNWAPFVSCFSEYGIYIHGPIYRSPKDRGSMFPWAYREIGSNATSGCLRTTYYGAYWIYTHCPRGTVIKIKNNGSGLTYPTKPARDPRYPTWDPTDPDKPRF